MVVVTACGSAAPPAAKPARIQGLQPRPAPEVGDLSLPDGPDGTELALRAEPGGLLIVYFGYTFCPDICPGTLAGLKLALRKIGSDRDRVQVAMITVDPERDTAPVLVDYLDHFFRDSHALRTDDPARLATVAERFGVRYEIQKHTAGETEVGHTSLLFAVDDRGTVVDAWPFGMEDTKISSDLRLLLARERATTAGS